MVSGEVEVGQRNTESGDQTGPRIASSYQGHDVRKEAMEDTNQGRRVVGS